MGSALLADLSMRFATGDGRGGDPARLAAQIVSGVGFLGAGTIMQARGTVTGLTSAATIWVVAAMGIAVGAGFYVEAAGTGILVTLVLAGLGRLEHRLRRVRRTVSCTIRARPHTPFDMLEQTLKDAGIHVLAEETYDHPDDRVFELRLAGPARQFEVVTDTLLQNDAILSIHVA